MQTTRLETREQPSKPAVPRRVRRALALDDFEPLAKRFLPRMIHGYIAGSVETGSTMRAIVSRVVV